MAALRFPQYPLNLFFSIRNLSEKYIKRTPDIFDEVNRAGGATDLYILNELYRFEINKYIKDKKIQYQDTERIGLLRYLNNIYQTKLTTPFYNSLNIEEFCRLFIKCKNDIITIIQDINSFFLLFENGNKKNNNIYFLNPLNPSLIHYGLLDEIFINSRITHSILGQDEENIKIALNIFINSSIINIKMPSIGLISDNYLLIGRNKKTYISFIEFILNRMFHNNSLISNEIPLKELKLGDTLSDILLNDRPIKNLNLNNSNVFSNRFNNSETRKNIIDIINRIQINLNDVLKNKKTKKNRVNQKYKIKSEYIIPYKIHEIPGEDPKIVYMKKSEIDKELDTLDKTLIHNQKILKFVLDQTVVMSFVPGTIETSITNLDKPNFKNVLACFMYILIRFVYTISKNYIDQINDIILSMSTTRKGKFRGLNYKDSLNYLSLLDMSLLNFRNILLNNFYNMFLPSQISKMGYGMTTDINGCFVPEPGCVFLGDSENILSKFPIVDCLLIRVGIPLIPINNLYTIDLNKLYLFICKISDKYDIYNKSKILEIGGYVFNKDIMKFVSKLLKEYYTHLKKIMEYNLFIFEKLTNYFNVKKMIPFRVIGDFRLLRDYMINIRNNAGNTDADYQRLDKDVFAKFEYNLSKSTEYYKNMYSTKIQIQKIKQNNISKLYSYKDMYLMCFNIFYKKSMVLYSMTQNLLNNTKLKFSLLKKFNERKIFYETEINNFMQNTR